MTGDRRVILFALCVGAVLVRVVTAAWWPNVAHPDETFQYLEQAYRLATGRGMVPWEYAVGARSWIVPGLITPVIKAGVALSADPAVRLWGVTLFMTAIAAIGVVAAFTLGTRAGGLIHGILAGLLSAFWCELVYLSPHVLADTLAAVALIAALAALYKVDAPSFRRLACAGFLFGLAFIVRIQLAPAIGLAMIALCGRDVRSRYGPMGLGFAGPLVLLGVTDWVALGAPFQSVLTYLRVNAGGVADTFGRAPALGYVATEFELWGFATPLILITAGIGARKLPLLAAVATVIVVTFSLIGHKEYRFLYPALPLLFVLCASGTADLVDWWGVRRVEKGLAPGSMIFLSGAAVLWLSASVAAGAGPAMQRKWHQESGWLEGFRIINADPAACGVGVDPPDVWFLTGLVRLRAGVGLYEGALQPESPSSAAYNYLFAFEPKDASNRDIGAFHQLTCGGSTRKVCVYMRSGGCDPSRGRPLEADPGPDVRAVLRRLSLMP